MSSSKISVFIVDDHPLIRQALEASILAESDMEVVGMAVDGAEAIEAIPILLPNVVIMGLMLPKIGGLAAMELLRESCPSVAILAFSSIDKDETVFKAVQMGARGYVTKDVPDDELIRTIRLLSRGRSCLPSEITEKLIDGVRQNFAKEEMSELGESLTRRERELLVLLGEGYSNYMIGESMEIAEGTVRVHLYRIMQKMSFENRHDAVFFAAHQGVGE